MDRKDSHLLTSAKRKDIDENENQLEKEEGEGSIEQDLLFLRSLQDNKEDPKRKKMKQAFDQGRFVEPSPVDEKITSPPLYISCTSESDFESSDDDHDRVPEGGWLAPPSISKKRTELLNNDMENMQNSNNYRLQSRIGEQYQASIPELIENRIGEQYHASISELKHNQIGEQNQASIPELRIPSILEGGIHNEKSGSPIRGQQQIRKAFRLESRIGKDYQAVIPELIVSSPNVSVHSTNNNNNNIDDRNFAYHQKFLLPREKNLDLNNSSSH